MSVSISTTALTVHGRSPASLAREKRIEQRPGGRNLGGLGVARRDDSAQRDSEEPALPLHDASTTSCSALLDGYFAGVDGQYSGQYSPRRTICETCAVAETEKFAHVTYFFNGGQIETPFPGEDRTLIPSLKVATYDLAPEMKAEAIGDTIVKAINDTAFDLVVANFANADMVGHSRKAGADHSCMRSCRCAAWAHLQGHPGKEWELADYGGSR